MENNGSVIAYQIHFLTPENSAFYVDDTGFLRAVINEEDKGRVYLYRTFPHDMTERYISVTDEFKNEYGILFTR